MENKPKVGRPSSFSEKDKKIREYLIENYGKMSNLEISRKFDNKRYQIEKNIDFLVKEGILERINHDKKIWTEEEDAFLLKNHSSMLLAEIGKILNRKEGDVSSRAYRFIKEGLLKKKFQKNFTPEEDEYILNSYNIIPIDKICEKLERPINTVRQRAYKLGLKLDTSFQFPLETKEKIFQLNSEGVSLKQIKKEINNIAGLTAIRNLLMKHGKTSDRKKVQERLDSLKVGEKIGKLTLLSKTVKKNSKGVNRTWWTCQCECGKEKEVGISRLSPSQNALAPINCGCLNDTSYEEISGSYWTSIRLRADSKKLSFEITKEYIWNLFLKQGRKCALSGVPLGFGKGTQKTASLDRIDSEKGYVKGNVQWVHKDVNYMKTDFPQEEFIEYCRLIANNNPLKNVKK
jgi:predicted transcriptional regulator